MSKHSPLMCRCTASSLRVCYFDLCALLEHAICPLHDCNRQGTFEYDLEFWGQWYGLLRSCTLFLAINIMLFLLAIFNPSEFLDEHRGVRFSSRKKLKILKYFLREHLRLSQPVPGPSTRPPLCPQLAFDFFQLPAKFETHAVSAAKTQLGSHMHSA